MRRTLLLVLVTAVVTSLVTSVTVSAATSGKEAAAPSGGGGSELRGARLPVIVDTKVDCGVPRGNRNWPNQDALEDTIRCLEDEVININRFMKAFFRCARIIEVSQYGEDPLGGTFGYEFDNGDGLGTFLTTGLDFTIDPTTEGFLFFMLWQNTSFCLS